jgi:Polysaccharide lyase
MKKISGLFWFFFLLLAACMLGSCRKTISEEPPVSTYTVSSDDQVDANEILGDFEKQPWDQQWNYVVGKDITKQFLIGNRSQIPVRQGNYAARFIVRPGDQEASGSTGERCEVGHFNDSQHGYTQEKPNDEFFYGWSTYIPNDWKTPTGWCTIAQWHARAATLSPIALYIGSDNSIGVNFYSGLVTMPASWYKNYAYRASFPLVKNFTRNAWHDFVVRIKFTPNNAGLVQIWHKMQWEKTWVMVLSKANIPTMQLYKPQDWAALDIDNHPRAPDNRIPWGSYITTQEWCRIGLYRGPNSFTNVIYHDNWARARWWSAIANNFQ